MAKFFDSLNNDHIEFIKSQSMFFVGTFSTEEGVNISPKGILPLKILDKNSVAYLDFFGSGNRTAEDSATGSPATIMFCSFNEKPLILRLFCKVDIIRPTNSNYGELLSLWGDRFKKKARNIFVFHLKKVQSSCGYGVPVFSFKGNKEEAKIISGS